MICLCCRKIISENASITEKETLWHDKCVTGFFGVKTLPLIDVSDDMLKKIAYDLLPVNIVNPADKDEMALTINGKKRNIRRNDFLKLSDSCGMQRKVAENIIKKVISNKENYIQECKNSYLTDELKEQMTALIEERCSRLSTEKEFI